MAREMKDSGIEWIGEIPKEWLCHSLKVIIVQNDGGIWGDDPINDDGELVLRSTEQTIDGKWNIVCPAKRDLSKIFNKKYYLCKKNDLLITKSSGSNLHIGKTTIVDDAIEKAQYYYSNFIQRIRLSQTVSAKYYWYILNSNIARSQFTHMQNTTSGIGNLNAQYIENLIVPKPPVQEQYYIERYLNVKCAEHDNILRKTRASIEEYKKLKQAVITQAVTKGIRGDREMKDSGIEWNNRIPVEWSSINPKALFGQRKDKAFEGEQQLTASQQYGIMYQSDYMELTGTKVVTVEKDFDILKHVEAGDFVISMRSFQGGLEYSELSGSISSAYVMLVPNLELVYPKFYRWLLKSEVYIRALQSTSNMVRDGQAMRYSNFLQVRLYIVPMEEQEEIAQYLDEKCAVIDDLIVKKEQYLSEIENYKKSLIYEYVTGKKEVPQKYQA